MKSPWFVISLALALFVSLSTVGVADLVALSDAVADAANQQKVTFVVPGMQ